jgi:hypothetical protein
MCSFVVQQLSLISISSAKCSNNGQNSWSQRISLIVIPALLCYLRTMSSASYICLAFFPFMGTTPRNRMVLWMVVRIGIPCAYIRSTHKESHHQTLPLAQEEYRYYPASLWKVCGKLSCLSRHQYPVPRSLSCWLHHRLSLDSS